MKKSVLALVLLPIAIQMSCLNEPPAPQSKVDAPEQPSTLTLLFDEDSRFSDHDKELIAEVIIRSERRVRVLLPTLPDEIEVTAVAIDRNIDVVGGVTGRANSPGVVLIELSNSSGTTVAGQRRDLTGLRSNCATGTLHRQTTCVTFQ